MGSVFYLPPMVMEELRLNVTIKIGPLVWLFWVVIRVRLRKLKLT